MYCSSCGEIIDNDCKFCTKCGQMIAKDQLKNKFGKVIFKGNLGEAMKLNEVYISLNGINMGKVSSKKFLCLELPYGVYSFDVSLLNKKESISLEINEKNSNLIEDINIELINKNNEDFLISISTINSPKYLQELLTNNNIIAKKIYESGAVNDFTEINNAKKRYNLYFIKIICYFVFAFNLIEILLAIYSAIVEISDISDVITSLLLVNCTTIIFNGIHYIFAKILESEVKGKKSKMSFLIIISLIITIILTSLIIVLEYFNKYGIK